jgi:hypothetical protein
MDKEKVEISSKGYDANSSKHSNENEFLLVKSLHPFWFMLYFADTCSTFYTAPTEGIAKEIL